MFYLERPDNFISKLSGAICFVECKEQFLMLKRSLTSHQGNTWTAAPGGKLEPGEEPLNAAVRELREETGIEVSPSALRFLHTVYFQLPDVDYSLHIFYTSVDEKPPVTIMPEEHTEYRWATFDEALKLPLMAGGKECIALCKEHLRV